MLISKEVENSDPGSREGEGRRRGGALLAPPAGARPQGFRPPSHARPPPPTPDPSGRPGCGLLRAGLAGRGGGARHGERPGSPILFHFIYGVCGFVFRSHLQAFFNILNREGRSILGKKNVAEEMAQHIRTQTQKPFLF